MNDPKLKQLIDLIESSHLISSFNVDRLVSGGYVADLSDNNEVVLSPFTVARIIDDSIYLVEIIEPRLEILDIEFIDILEQIVYNSKTIKTISNNTGININKCEELIEILMDKGMILATPIMNVVNKKVINLIPVEV